MHFWDFRLFIYDAPKDYTTNDKPTPTIFCSLPTVKRIHTFDSTGATATAKERITIQKEIKLTLIGLLLFTFNTTRDPQLAYDAQGSGRIVLLTIA